MISRARAIRSSRQSGDNSSKGAETAGQCESDETLSEVWLFWNLNDEELLNLIKKPSERKVQNENPSGSSEQTKTSQTDLTPSSRNLCCTFPITISDKAPTEAEIAAELAAGIVVGYPEFLCRLEVGADSLASWLGKVESVVLRHPSAASACIGKSYRMGDISFHGITVRTALAPSLEIKESSKLFKCWSKLIGKPLLRFLEKEGMNTSEAWLVNGPPVLSELGDANWQ